MLAMRSRTVKMVAAPFIMELSFSGTSRKF